MWLQPTRPGCNSQFPLHAVIGQLGVVGLGLYSAMVIYLVRRIVRLREYKIFALSLLLGVFVNILFNEVALSPNSSAGYFLLIGVLCMRRPTAVGSS